MAPRAKPATGKGKSKKKDGANGVSAEELQSFFDKIHGVTDEMEEASAASRGEIGRIYEKAADSLDMTKSAIMLLFKKQRRDRKDAAKAAKMDSRERDSMQKAAQAFGDDSPFGRWISDMVNNIPQEQPAES